MSYDNNLKKWKKAYTDILKVCEKYPGFDIYNFRDIDAMERSAKSHLMLIDWYEKYGLKINHEHTPYTSSYFKVSDYTLFNYFNDGERDKNAGSGKYISWSEDNKQPKNEWLFEVTFSTGAYIFGEDYESQQNLFQEFFKELQSFSPDYSDIHNNNLYWKLENAKPIYDEFSNILQKYRERNKSELKQRQVEKLRKQLEELES